jgi:hypothetical protein
MSRLSVLGTLEEVEGGISSAIMKMMKEKQRF